MRALISVSDKTGIVEFATALKNLGWDLIATGGTLKVLRGAGLVVADIQDVTGFPEICEGRVRLFTPKCTAVCSDAATARSTWLSLQRTASAL